MKQRPDRLIAKTGIEGFNFLFGQKNRVRVKAALRFRFDSSLQLRTDPATWPADPNIFGISDIGNVYSFEKSVQASGNTTGAALKFNVAILLGHCERQTIGNEDNSLGYGSSQIRILLLGV